MLSVFLTYNRLLRLVGKTGNVILTQTPINKQEDYGSRKPFKGLALAPNHHFYYCR